MQFSCIGFVIYYRERGLETNGFYTRRLYSNSGSRNRSYWNRSSCNVYYYREMVLKYLKEVTQWNDSTPNHIYIFDDKDQNVGYIKDGTCQKIMYKSPMKGFSKSRRKFVEIKYNTLLGL